MVKGCHPGHQAVLKGMRQLQQNRWMYVKLKIWAETCSHGRKTGNCILRPKKQANSPASPLRQVPLLKLYIEESIINQLVSLLHWRIVQCYLTVVWEITLDNGLFGKAGRPERSAGMFAWEKT